MFRASKECHDLTSHDTESGDGQEPNTTSAPEVESLIMVSCEFFSVHNYFHPLFLSGLMLNKFE